MIWSPFFIKSPSDDRFFFCDVFMYYTMGVVLMNLRIKWAAVKVLKKALGLKKVMGLLSILSNDQKVGEPWRSVPSPSDQKDIDSRALIGEAILLYRAIQLKYPAIDAVTIVKDVIRESAIMQLYSLIPKIDKKYFLILPFEEQKASLTKIVDQFPNADYHIQDVQPNRFAYRITRCRLVELVNQLGLPELRDAFCPGDGLYFERYQPDVLFERPCTIGYGKKYCDFIFSFKE